MRPVPAIVESVIAPAISQVRSLFSDLRETDAQVEKADKRFEDATRIRTRVREQQARLRLELGRALVEVRKQWPARGPKAKGWGEFLEREGIEERTARNYMELAGYADEISETHADDSETQVPTYADAGIDKRPRKGGEPRWDPDDVLTSREADRADERDAPPADEPKSEPTLDRTNGRGKPEWLMRALVRDYSRAGDLVCDPLAGYGTTLHAAIAEGRRAIGSERDPLVVHESGLGMLRAGDWQYALVDVDEVSTIISDPPYSKRTHAAKTTRNDDSDPEGLTPTYEPWTEENVHEFVRNWSPRCRGWIVALTDHGLIPHWEAAYAEAKRFSFAPVPVVIRGMSVRIRGDGPSSWCLYAMVARPRELAKWGTLPGAYVGTRERELWGAA